MVKRIFYWYVIGCACCWVLTSGNAVAQVGSLDPDFGDPLNGGPGYTLINSDTSTAHTLTLLSGLAVGASGRIIVVGNSNGSTNPNFRDGLVARLDANGTWLSSQHFNGFGCGPTPAAFDAGIIAEPGGSLITGGYRQWDCGGAGRNFWLRRLDADGSTLSVFAEADPGNHALAGALARTATGKIVAVGRATVANTFSDFEWGVARWNADGSLDTGFGNNGVLRLPISDDQLNSDIPYDVAALPDGRILIIGGATSGGRTDIAIVRLNEDGSLDQSFGVGGVVTHDLEGFDDLPLAIELLGDGRFLVAGRVGVSAEQFRMFIARFLADGSFDASFGSNGIVKPDFGDQVSGARAMVRQYDGKPIIAGFAETGGGGTNTRIFAVVRLTNNGDLDPTFNGNGIQTIDLFPGNQQAALAITTQRTGSATTPGNNTIREDILIAGIYADTPFRGIIMRLIGDPDHVFHDRFEQSAGQ